jgi:hypothetical protein
MAQVQTESDRKMVPVDVQVGGSWLHATALATRIDRRGSQVLVSCHGRLIWVPTGRVRKRLN